MYLKDLKSNVIFNMKNGEYENCSNRDNDIKHRIQFAMVIFLKYNIFCLFLSVNLNVFHCYKSPVYY